MAIQNLLWACALILPAFWIFILRITRVGRREPHLPPGPPTIPLLGNATHIPRQRLYVRLSEWAKEYGGIYSLKILSSTMIVLTDPAAVYELLDKRSATTAGRPAMFLADTVTGGIHLGLLDHGKMWKLLRRCVNDILSPSESNKHRPIQTAETSQLLYDILNTPEDFYEHLSRFANSIIMSIVYGIRTPRSEIKHAKDFFDMEERWTEFLGPDQPPLDFIPILRYLPERWALWKREGREIRQIQQKLYLGLLSGVEDNLRRGDENGSFLESVLNKQKDLQMDRELIAYLGGVLIEGGSETTASFLRTLVLALVENPAVVRRAQEEMEKVVGEMRTPTIEDAVHLPYIHAIVNETYRFRPMAPLAIPHLLASDEIYLNYRLPKGASVILNLWGIFHDPDIFDEPDTFDPDRYIRTQDGTKPGYQGPDLRATLIFGAGRRVCPGMYVANNTQLLAVMNLIWAFDFKRPLDTDGQPIALDLDDYISALTIQPKPFKCRILPRSQARAALIEANFGDASETLAKFEHGLNAAERSKW